MKVSAKNNKIAKAKESKDNKSAVQEALTKVDEAAEVGQFEVSIEINPNLIKLLVKELKSKRYTVCAKRLTSSKTQLQIYWGPSSNKSSIYYRMSKDVWASKLSSQGYHKL